MKTQIALILSLVGALLLGVWLGGSLRARGQEAGASGSPNPAAAPRWPELGEVLEELRGLRADQRMVPTSQGEPRSAMGSASDAAELVRALDEHSALLLDRRDVEGSSAIGTSPRRTTATGFLSLNDLFQVSDSLEIATAHLFWTLREVLERYGPPAANGERDGSLWVAYRAKDGSDHTRWFYFAEGVVVRAEAD